MRRRGRTWRQRRRGWRPDRIRCCLKTDHGHIIKTTIQAIILDARGKWCKPHVATPVCVDDKVCTTAYTSASFVRASIVSDAIHKRSTRECASRMITLILKHTFYCRCTPQHTLHGHPSQAQELLGLQWMCRECPTPQCIGMVSLHHLAPGSCTSVDSSPRRFQGH